MGVPEIRQEIQLDTQSSSSPQTGFFEQHKPDSIYYLHTSHQETIDHLHGTQPTNPIFFIDIDDTLIRRMWLCALLEQLPFEDLLIQSLIKHMRKKDPNLPTERKDLFDYFKKHKVPTEESTEHFLNLCRERQWTAIALTSRGIAEASKTEEVMKNIFGLNFHELSRGKESMLLFSNSAVVNPKIGFSRGICYTGGKMTKWSLFQRMMYYLHHSFPDDSFSDAYFIENSLSTMEHFKASVAEGKLYLPKPIKIHGILYLHVTNKLEEIIATTNEQSVLQDFEFILAQSSD